MFVGEPDAIRVLQLEDNPADAELVARRLIDDGLSIVCRVVASEHAFRKALSDFAPQVVLSDFSLPGFDGLSALTISKEEAAATPFIFVSGTIGEERAIEALKRGAVDYVLKDNLRRLVPSIRSALRQAEATQARDLAEEMLRRSESRLQDIINTSRDWVWECDREGRFTFSSPSVLELLGYKHHEVLGRRAIDYMDPADEPQLQATLAELAGDREFRKVVTLRWRHKTGKVRWLERAMVALRDDADVLTGVRGIDRDVTLRMTQELRIRRLNRALRFVSGASSAVMRLRDRDQLIREACRLAVSVGGYAKAPPPSITMTSTPSLAPMGEPSASRTHAVVERVRAPVVARMPWRKRRRETPSGPGSCRSWGTDSSGRRSSKSGSSITAPQASWKSGEASRSSTRFGGIDQLSPSAFARVTHASSRDAS
jgi:PAS domain S-box-containing protein